MFSQTILLLPLFFIDFIHLKDILFGELLVHSVFLEDIIHRAAIELTADAVCYSYRHFTAGLNSSTFMCTFAGIKVEECY